MAEDCSIAPTPRAQLTKVEVARVAERQHGAIARWQLERIGLSGTSISRWVATCSLHRLYPGVYAVGHRALSVRGRLTAALFYAGPGAALSHATGAWWWQLVAACPELIHVSTPRQRRAVADLVVRGRRTVDTVVHNGLPVTSVSRTLLDLAQLASASELRRAIAEAEYRRLIDLPALEATLGPGRPGSAALRRALARHVPQVAFARSVLEERFIELCQAHRIPLPQINATVCGLTVDALWPDERVIVELDGHAAHAIPARVERDRQRELRLRGAGFLVLRYTWQQVAESPAKVAADVRRALGRLAA